MRMWCWQGRGSWEGWGARPLGPCCHLLPPAPASAPSTVGRQGALSRCGPGRALRGWWPRRLPQLPHLTRISAYSASSSVRV